MDARSIVVAGAVARRAAVGGHAWAFLQYVLGFRRLGLDVLFLDQVADGDGAGAVWLESLMARFEVPFSLLGFDGAAVAGVPRRDALRRTRQADLLLNVNGYLDDADFLHVARRRVFLDIDPGFVQMWRELELADVFADHDTFVTVGENIGRPGCGVPTCGLDWITTRPPVVLDHWPVAPARDGAFTSVASWRGAFGPIEYGGQTFGLRVHEFRKFASLPMRTGADFELALDIDPVEERDLALLAENGWRLVEPRAVAGTTDAYRAYIRGSKAEVMVAKNMYVDTRSGWFSDRSVCYLASGKPVLTQDTGLERLYPVGEGLLTFRTLDEAVAGVEAITRDYDRHARAARAIAEEHFDSDKVLSRLLEELA